MVEHKKILAPRSSFSKFSRISKKIHLSEGFNNKANNFLPQEFIKKKDNFANQEQLSLFTNPEESKNIEIEEKDSMGLIKHIAPVQTLPGVYTGGKCTIAKNDSIFAGLHENNVNLYDMNLKKITTTISHKNEEIINFDLAWKKQLIITYTRNRLLRKVNLLGHSTERVLKIADHFIHDVVVDKTESFVATGGSNGAVQVLLMKSFSLLHYFKYHKSPILKLSFHQTGQSFTLFSSAEDYLVKGYDLATGAQIYNVKGHDSNITSISADTYTDKFFSCMLNGKIQCFDLNLKKVVKTIVPEEEDDIFCSECIHVKDKKSYNFFVVGGDKGILYVYNSESLAEIDRIPVITKNSLIYLKFLPSKKGLIVITSENDMFAYKVLLDANKKLLLQLDDSFMLFNDEIIDLRFFKKGKRKELKNENDFGLENLIVVATNSNNFRVHDLVNNKTTYVEGHTDIVMVTDVYHDLILTGSKDNTLKLWRIHDINSVQCLATLKGHMGNIISLSMAPKTGYFCVSISQDNTIKLWDISKEVVKSIHEEEVMNESIKTVIGHEKEMNVIRVSPDDKLIATGGHDKLIKIWDKKLQMKMVLQGHQRGVWDVQFSQITNQLLSASGDKLIKIWNLENGTCEHTLSGHTSNVMKVFWLRFGLQVVSSSSDGSLKLWNVKKSTCLGTFEKHEGKAWTLDVKEDHEGCPQFVTGGNDSTIILWKDDTTNKMQEESSEKAKVLKDQVEIFNLKRNNEYEKAVLVAFENAMNKTIYETLHDYVTYVEFNQEIVYTDFDDVDSNTNFQDIEEIKTKNEEKIESLIQKLFEKNVSKLVEILRNMNAISKYYNTAQILLAKLWKIIGLNNLQENKSKIQDFDKIVEVMLAYTERHYDRLGRYLKLSHSLDFFLDKAQI